MLQSEAEVQEELMAMTAKLAHEDVQHAEKGAQEGGAVVQVTTDCRS